MQSPRLTISLFSLLLFFLSFPAQASLTTDLQSLEVQLSGLRTQAAGITINSTGSCSQLGTLNTSVENYTASVESVSAGLSAPLYLTAEDLTSLDDLSVLSRGLAEDAVRLSWELRSLEGAQNLIEYRAGLSAMLRLSDDIGTMADRILEMADRILTMADNIGTMADRILFTQSLQNSNIALTQSALLTTQNNMVALSDSLSSIGYNLSLGLLSDESQVLANSMANTVLTQTNMASELGRFETSTALLVTRAVDLYTAAMLNSQGASHYINGDTLTVLGDLGTIHAALAKSLESYAAAINTLAPLTDNAVLRDATASMLRLTRDIGLMSDRIMEMSDKIIVMADNIGLMSDRIVETQNIQQTNVLLTERSLLTAQSVVIGTIKNAGL